MRQTTWNAINYAKGLFIEMLGEAYVENEPCNVNFFPSLEEVATEACETFSGELLADAGINYNSTILLEVGKLNGFDLEVVTNEVEEMFDDRFILKVADVCDKNYYDGETYDDYWCDILDKHGKGEYHRYTYKNGKLEIYVVVL